MQPFQPPKASDVQVLPDPVRRWLPATAAQKAALDCDADILLLGGAAGSLKTSTILVDLIQEREFPKMNSYFFRKTYPELEEAMQQGRELFTQTGAVSRDNGREYYWPGSGAHFRFRHLNHEKDLDSNQGKAMSAIGIDESTHLKMDWIRYLITRNRSTDPNLGIRTRLGTNPGNIAHKDHKKMFFGGVCPHCVPNQAPPQGVLRWDGRWHDGVPLKDGDTGHALSIAYILSYVRDHNLLGSEYVSRLKMQRPATAKALLEGCWEIFEGQYFDVFEPGRVGMPMVVPRHSIKDQWWWPTWLSSDFGFSISVTAAHQFVHEPQSEKWPRGRIYVIDELPKDTQETAANLGRLIVKRWALGEGGKPLERRWMPCYLSPDSYRDIGVAFTIAQQINEQTVPYGINFVSADNDRTGGALKIYTALESGELVICDNCPQTIEALETRIHDDKKENDVLKVSGDPLDDFYDSFRYGFKSFETARDVSAPLKVRIEQRLEEMWKKDPTTAMFQVANMMAEEKGKDGPTVYSGNARRRMDALRHKR